MEYFSGTTTTEQGVSIDLEAKKADIKRRIQENPSVERGVLINFESGKTKEQLIDIVNKLKNGEINLSEIIKEFFNLPINTLSEVKEAFNDGTLADKIQFGLDTKELSDLQPKTISRESIINAKQKAIFQKQKTEAALKDSEYKTVKKTDPITGKVTETKVKRTAEEKTKYEDFHKKALEDVNKEIEKYDEELKALENNNKTLPSNETEQTTKPQQSDVVNTQTPEIIGNKTDETAISEEEQVKINLERLNAYIEAKKQREQEQQVQVSQSEEAISNKEESKITKDSIRQSLDKFEIFSNSRNLAKSEIIKILELIPKDLRDNPLENGFYKDAGITEDFIKSNKKEDYLLL